MFGQKDNPTNDGQALQPGDDNLKGFGSTNQHDSHSADEALAQLAADTSPAEPVAESGDNSWQHPGKPLQSAGPTSDAVADSGATATHAPEGLSEERTRDLVEIRHNALQQLAPLLGNLKQSPEEHFRTLMMVIQASDDDSLIAKAYEIAKNLEDDQERAQALLDIVNEINYFTHPPEE